MDTYYIKKMEWWSRFPGLSLFKAMIFSLYIHWLYVAAGGKCFYKDRLANSRDGKFQLIKITEEEKPHFRVVNTDGR